VTRRPYGCTAECGEACASAVQAALRLDFRSVLTSPAGLRHLWNFTTAWKGIMGSNFDADFWIKNLMDKKYAVYNSPQQLQFGYYTELRGEPRTFGANLRYNF
jgi:outer membrane receptor protein involved in Fe transport